MNDYTCIDWAVKKDAWHTEIFSMGVIMGYVITAEVFMRDNHINTSRYDTSLIFTL